jgi:polysaccharide export outer membrane protein
MSTNLFVLLLLFAAASCISNRQYTLLQKGDVNRKALRTDTTVRAYYIDSFYYKIQPNDILSISFESRASKEWDVFNTRHVGNLGLMQAGNPLLAGELVDERGEISLPVLGKVPVAGLSVFQIQNKLQTLADRFVESPIVKVRLLNFRITVLGEVKSSGAFTLMNNRVNMLEAIALAGGFSDLADRESVKLIRQNGMVIQVQYLNLLDEKFIESPYFYVHQGDILLVPPLRQRPFRTYFGPNLALLVSVVSVALLTYNIVK